MRDTHASLKPPFSFAEIMWSTARKLTTVNATLAIAEA